jgi:hypothetical protein
MKKLKKYILLILISLSFNSIYSQSIFNVNSRTISFLNANKSHYPNTSNGTAVGNTTLYTNVITVGTQRIDCIVKTVSLTGGTFLTSITPSFDHNANAATGMSANEDSFFSPLFSWNSGGGNCEFEFQFILGGSFNSTTLNGTNVMLQNVFVNTYDIDGNGTTNSNQFNEFGGFSSTQFQTTTGGLINAAYNSNTSKTRFSSTTSANITTVTDDRTRVRVFYENLSKFSFVVGAGSGGGTAYYFIDFGIGPNWTNTPAVISPPSLDLNTSTTGLNNTNTLSACNTPVNFSSGTTNITGVNSIVDNIYVQFNNTQILDGSSEVLNINGATSGANISLNFTNGATIPQVIHNGITYNVSASNLSGISKLTFSRPSSGTLTSAQAELFIDALRYTNTDCGTLSLGERSFDVSIKEVSFESEKANFLIDVATPLPIDLISYIAKPNNGSVDLSWTTFGENRNPFNILKSTDGNNWTTIGSQTPTENSVHYLFTDYKPSTINYYQLSQLDNSNTLQYSDIRIVNFNSNKLVIFPNPNNGEFTIQSNHAVEFQIIDYTGKIIMEGDNSNPLIKTNLEKGIYFIKITEDEKTIFSKMIVQ